MYATSIACLVISARRGASARVDVIGLCVPLLLRVVYVSEVGTWRSCTCSVRYEGKHMRVLKRRGRTESTMTVGSVSPSPLQRTSASVASLVT